MCRRYKELRIMLFQKKKTKKKKFPILKTNNNIKACGVYWKSFEFTFVHVYTTSNHKT